MGVRKGAFDVAEEFALKEGFRDGAGVHGHHRLPAPEAVEMDFPRQDVLAGAVFAGDEHRGVGGGDFVYGFADGGHGLGTAPEHGFFASPRMTGRPLGRISSQGLHGLVPGGGERCHQFFVVPGLDDEIEGSAFHPFHRQGDIGISRKEDHFHLRSHFLDFSGPVEAFVAGVDAGREVHVQEHHVRAELLQGCHQRGRGGKGLHLGKVQGQQNLQRPADAGVVIDNQYFSFF